LPVSGDCFSEGVDLCRAPLHVEGPDKSLPVLPREEVIEWHKPHIRDAADLCNLNGRAPDVLDDRNDLQKIVRTRGVLSRRFGGSDA
jgi:hypothetical protein